MNQTRFRTLKTYSRREPERIVRPPTAWEKVVNLDHEVFYSRLANKDSVIDTRNNCSRCIESDKDLDDPVFQLGVSLKRTASCRLSPEVYKQHSKFKKQRKVCHPRGHGGAKRITSKGDARHLEQNDENSECDTSPYRGSYPNYDVTDEYKFEFERKESGRSLAMVGSESDLTSDESVKDAVEGDLTFNKNRPTPSSLREGSLLCTPDLFPAYKHRAAHVGDILKESQASGHVPASSESHGIVSRLDLNVTGGSGDQAVMESTLKGRKALLTRFSCVLNLNESDEHENADQQQSFLPKSDEKTARESILHMCNQSAPVSFLDIFAKSTLSTCTKLGEGTFGEVFEMKMNGKSVAAKIMPIQGNALVHGEKQMTFSEVYAELLVARFLSDLRGYLSYRCSSFAEVCSIHLIRGRYPKKMIEEWHKYDEEHTSFNEDPSIFGSRQLFIALVAQSSGMDLEKLKITEPLQAWSIVWQLCLALAVAEHAYKFEHRDLHCGNILVRQTSNSTVSFLLNDVELTVPSHGVCVTIVDYSLSRLMVENLVYYSRLESEKELFEGVGDEQYDLYRMMRDNNKCEFIASDEFLTKIDHWSVFVDVAHANPLNHQDVVLSVAGCVIDVKLECLDRNNWKMFYPATNVMWLRYICNKLSSGMNCKLNWDESDADLRRLTSFAKEIECCSSALDIVKTYYLTHIAHHEKSQGTSHREDN